MPFSVLTQGQSFPLIEGYQVRLLSPTDMPAICAMLAEPEVNRFLYFAPADESVYYDYFTPQFEQMALAIEQGSALPQLMLAIVDTDGKFAGMAALVASATEDGSETERGLFDVGYQLPTRSWGKGLATAATRLLTNIAFEAMGAQRLRADTYDDNQGSKRVLEKCGFARAGKDYGFFDDGAQDRCWFSQSRAQFERSKQVATL
ncbi:GNAT family N-acetyltransferase [Aliagarivorans taiwanensis]|uniref:GNAT family N-acetyltransferase n=1 Tax=Aliagarivorans taiwanensis TaxID=561966 RepID=UPI000401789F|nr:GNAT family N-acetyltransferase [Aliagarivorans taiwanensis]